jgi:hypothetical protein
MDQVTYLPTSNDDQQRQQLAARAFYLVGDYFRGSDAQGRFDPGMSGGTVLGPNQTGVDFGVGNGGEVFIRGRSGQVGINSTAPSAPAAAAAAPGMAMLRHPLVLLGLVVAAFLLLRK